MQSFPVVFMSALLKTALECFYILCNLKIQTRSEENVRSTFLCKAQKNATDLSMPWY